MTINFVDVKRAMTLLFSTQPAKLNEYGHVVRPAQPKARVIDPLAGFQDFDWQDWSRLRPAPGEPTISSLFRVPRIILLPGCDRMPNRTVPFNRRAVYVRDNHTCQYCGRKPKVSELSIDHVLPRCQQGKTEWTNIVLACTKCNGRKAGRTPEQAGMVLAKVPVKPMREADKEDWMTNPETFDNFVSVAYWNTELVDGK